VFVVVSVVSWCVLADIDECALGLCKPVQHSVNCMNMDGTYYCVCENGYINRNNSCIGKSSSTN